MWLRIVDMAKDGRALMVFSRRGDQGLDFRVHRHDWQPVDLDGITLIRRPEGGVPQPAMRPGWSSASRRIRARKVK
jgi:CRISPR-associated protein Cas2